MSMRFHHKYLRQISVIILLLGVLFIVGSKSSKGKEKSNLRIAMFYQKLDNKKVRCEICFRNCVIAPQKRGFCRNRENRDGVLYNLVHSKPSAVHIDPIEKEPQLHMLPGTEILCIGTAGCNFRCKFCHNWHLSQKSIEEMDYIELPPESVVALALKRNIKTISFTYNDPIAFYEYMYDITRLAKTHGLKILFHTNATLNPEPLKELLKYTDAVTVDLKGFTEKFYQEASVAELRPVLNSLKIIKEQGCWLEIVNLVIPTLNDDWETIRKMCIWIRDTLGSETPLHFSRFFPNYKLTNLPPTPISTLERAHKIAKEVGLEYVTIGNVPGHKYNSTYCPKCGKRIIYRVHFTVLENNVIKGSCKFCKHKIPGIWE